MARLVCFLIVSALAVPSFGAPAPKSMPPAPKKLARVPEPAPELRRKLASLDDAYRGGTPERFAELEKRAAALAKELPLPGRAVFLVMVRTYRALLDEIVRRDYDVFAGRVRLAGWYKLWLAASALPVRFGLWA